MPDPSAPGPPPPSRATGSAGRRAGSAGRSAPDRGRAAAGTGSGRTERDALAAELRALRLACGNPSYAALRRRSALLPPATISDALAGRVVPRLEFVTAFVTACLDDARDHGIEVDPELTTLAGWRRRWQRVRQDADALARTRHAGGRDRAGTPGTGAGPRGERPGTAHRQSGDPGSAHAQDQDPRGVAPGADDRTTDEPSAREAPAPAVGPPAGETWHAPIPWQLPHAVRRLYGRQSELDWLDRVALGPEPDSGVAAKGGGEAAQGGPDGVGGATAAGAGSGTARGEGDAVGAGSSPIVVLEGMGGVGKTALAVAWGHRRRAAFPDGQLFADLAGYGIDEPVDPAQVLAVFVRALGAAPQAVPGDVDGLAALFRSQCADRKLLVLLDNAADPEQVRPLLPAAPGVVVVITSRSSLVGLAVRDDARRLQVRPLGDDDAVALLSRDLAGVDPEHLRSLAAACGNLPLALRVVSSRFASGTAAGGLLDLISGGRDGGPDRPAGSGTGRTPGRPAASSALLAAMADPSDPSSDVSAVLSWSMSRCPPAERRALMLLSISPGGDRDDYAAAAVIGLPVGPVRQMLADLADRHLVERPRPGRWWMHDLVRAWARGEAERRLGAQSIHDAARRALGYYLWTSDACDRMLLPQRNRPPLSTALPRPLSLPRFGDRADALAWADAGLPALVDAVAAAANRGEHACAAQLPHVLLSYFNLRKPWTAWLTTCRIGLESALTLGDTAASAHLYVAIGIVRRETHDLDGATAALTAAGDAYRAAGNRLGTAMALNNLATVLSEAGHPRRALEALRTAGEQFGRRDDPYRRAIVLHNLAEAEADLGELESAAEHAATALDAATESGDTLGAATTRTTLGRIEMLLGRPEVAAADFAAALAVQREGGDRLGQATTQRHLGELLLRAGRIAEAVTALTESAAILSELGDPAAAEVAGLLRRARSPEAPPAAEGSGGARHERAPSAPDGGTRRLLRRGHRHDTH